MRVSKLRGLTQLVAIGLPCAALSAQPITVTDPDDLTDLIAANCDSINAARTAEEGCAFELPCGRHEISQDPNSTWPRGIDIDDRKNVRIRGCGMNGTTLVWNLDNSTSSLSNGKLLAIHGSRFVTIQDLKLEVLASCDPTSATCTNTFSAAYVGVGSRDVLFERVHFHVESKPGVGGISPAGLSVGHRSEVDGNGEPTNRSVVARDSRFHSSGTGVIFTTCNDCWVAGSWLGVMDISGVQSTHWLAMKERGAASRFINNTFDMRASFVAASSSDAITGLVLFQMLDPAGDPDAPSEAGRLSQVIGNTFLDIGPGTYNLALSFYGYSNALIKDNVFRCDAGSPCSRGIRWREGRCEGDCNARSIIRDNQFEGFKATSTQCPIHLTSESVGTDPNAFDLAITTHNVVEGNVFVLSDTSDPYSLTGPTDPSTPAICGGDSGAENFVGTNYTYPVSNP